MILVTGSDGFIGSHVVETLIEQGKSVRAFCLYNSFGSKGWLEESSLFQQAVEDGQAEVWFGDIRDAENVMQAAKGVDTILHLAALIAIPYSYVSPRSYVETNVTGTLNVLEAARRHGVRRVVQTSTSEVYGTPETVPILETNALKGQSPYSATKIAADKLCESYALSFETPVVVLRPFNTYGPRQSLRAVIPTILAQLLAGANEVKLGDLTPKRDFTFVKDTAAAFAATVDADLTPGTVVQLGTGEAVSIGETFDLCAEVTNTEARVVSETDRIRPSKSEVQLLLSNPARAEGLIGWKPTVSLAEGLRSTADWLAADPKRLAGAARYNR